MAQIKLLKVGANRIPRQHNSTADELTMLTGQFGNLKLAGNTLSSEDANGDIILNPNGTGLVNINGAYTLPNTDGTLNQILTTDGAGTVTFQDPGTAKKVCKDYVADTGGVSVRDVVYISSAGKVSPADASAEATSRVIGLADATAALDAAVGVCSEGVVSGFTGLTTGARYFLDTVTPGAITTTPADDDEQALVQIGYAKSTTELDLQIEVIAEIEVD